MVIDKSVNEVLVRCGCVCNVEIIHTFSPKLIQDPEEIQRKVSETVNQGNGIARVKELKITYCKVSLFIIIVNLLLLPSCEVV